MRRCPFYYRAIRIAKNVIKPAYVLDGKLPELKAGGVRINNSSHHILHLG